MIIFRNRWYILNSLGKSLKPKVVTDLRAQRKTTNAAISSGKRVYAKTAYAAISRIRVSESKIASLCKSAQCHLYRSARRA